MRLVAVLALLLLAAWPTHAQDFDPEPWFPGNYQVVFESVVDADPVIGVSVELFRANADGTEIKRLTDNEAHDSQGTWSPDGNHIAFTSNRDGVPEIYIMDADGLDVRRLTSSSGFDVAPQWSPDGTMIAFQSTRRGAPDIYLINVDGSNLRNITNHPYFDTSPSWSPDGRQIIFSSSRSGTDAIYTMDLDGDNIELLLKSERRLLSPVWSPDGNTLAYLVGNPNYGSHLYILNMLTGESTQISPEDYVGDIGGVAWSPDGQILSYTVVEPGYQSFYYHLSTGTMGQFTWLEADSSGLAWRPETVEDVPVTPTQSPG